MKTTEEERADAFEVALRAAIAQATTMTGIDVMETSQTQKVRYLFKDELEAAEGVRVLDREEHLVYVAGQVLLNTEHGEDMSDLRRVASGVLQVYLTGEPTKAKET